jgi:hypothetical protein
VKNGEREINLGASREWLPRPLVARVLHQIAVRGLFADVVLLVVAMAFGGVEGNGGRTAGALVALVVVGNRRDGFRHGFRHPLAPLPAKEDNARRDDLVPLETARAAGGKYLLIFRKYVKPPNKKYFAFTEGQIRT